MKQADRIYFGGDYNPDQWDEKTLQEDMRMFRKAGINLLTLPVFSWAKLEPDEGVYDFDWLTHIIDVIWQNGIRVCLATPPPLSPPGFPPGIPRCCRWISRAGSAPTACASSSA